MMRVRWRGPKPAKCEEQIANAPDDFAALTPVSEAPAEQTRQNWAATVPDQDAPLIWER